MAFVGMVIEEVETLAAQMRQRSSEIESLIAQLTSQLEGAHWIGPDREQFHGDWHGTHVPALRTVANGLQDAAAHATRNAAQQRDASAT